MTRRYATRFMLALLVGGLVLLDSPVSAQMGPGMMGGGMMGGGMMGQGSEQMGEVSRILGQISDLLRSQ